MRYFFVILGIFGAEWKVKNDIEERMEEGRTKEKCGGFLLIRKHHNRGAFLNAGQDRRKVVVRLSVCLTAALTVLFLATLGNAGKGLLKWGLTFLLGGAYSNTYDRLVRKYVVDYVSFNVPFGLRKVIFNISDFCIMVGALLSVIGWEKQ
ncbi:signal peptidase II [Parablautia muri]|uniref:Signal peptidase II n=1 Tax=Parablautia muri TaxID=2320879 RepID=A0A9X5BFB7_9FIRM|nr:signal peptidase II [Parablautia muri]NBJ92748.1 signal peptidase II [Parablautia muri]